MASDEILLKVALDLDKASSEFKDFSGLWEKHNGDIKKGNEAMQKHADGTAKAYETLNKKIKENITQVGNEGKAVENLEKKMDNLGKKNKESFDTKDLDKFVETLKKASAGFGGMENIGLTADDIDKLSKKLAVVEDDFEALNVLVEFFEEKMRSSATSSVSSFDELNTKIEETKLNIKSTQDYIKDVEKDIKTTAPGQAQANLIQEREAAKKALLEEKVALADYEAQMKKARIENVSMTTQLRKVKDELIQLDLAGERGGERWNQLSQEAEKYNRAIRDTNAEITRTSKATAGLDNLLGAATGVVAFFTAAQGAAALFGEENEDLQKSLVKLTGAIALLNGLQQIQVELAKQGTISNRALVFVQTQYATVTNASATATMRLVAASKLLGIGLIIGGLTYLITNWKDVSKWIGITSEKTERLNDLNKAAVTSASGEIGRLKSLKLELTNVNTPLSRQREIRKELLDQYPTYLKALGDEKSTVDEIEAAFDKLNKALLVNAKLKAAQDLISEEFRKVLEAERKAAEGELSTWQYIVNGIKVAAGADLSNVAKGAVQQNQDNLNEVKKDYESFETFIQKYVGDLNQELDKLGGDPTKDGKRFEALKKEYEDFAKTLEQLLRRQEGIQIALMDNTREKEKALLNQALEDEKEAYRKQIEELKISENAKAKLRAEYNKIYNSETGSAYEQYQKAIADIDAKYDAQAEEVRFKALSAISEVYGTQEQLEREAIGKKWETIRKDIEDQIKLTNDELKKQELVAILKYTVEAQGQEENIFDLDRGLDRIDREKDIADSILRIYQINARDLIDNEEVKQLQLLRLDKQYLDNVLEMYKNSLKDVGDQGLFDELLETLQTSIDPKEIEEVGQKLREAFGDTVADEILRTVGALREVSQGIEDIGEKSNFEKLIDDFGKWTESIESFSKQLAKSLGFQGKAAEEFASGIATAIESTWGSLQTIFDAEIDQHRQKIDSFQESIDKIENELDRERKLYEDGYANNYDEREKDLENLKEQKKKEEEELQKAQKRKAALAKAEMLVDTVSQLGNMITASSNIFKWASKIPIVGVPLAIGLIATMFGAFAAAKTKAFQAIGQGQNFRKGLGEGSLKLSGPKHEERGFGLFNSKTGERVAEFEDGEEILISNKQQSRKYRHILDALIADAQGRSNIDSTLEGYYGVKKVGKQTMQVIKHVNNVSVIAQKSKEEASYKDDSLLKEFKDFKDSFKREFDGYKKERDNEIESWETPHFFHVKKGNTVKKYPKKDSDS